MASAGTRGGCGAKVAALVLCSSLWGGLAHAQFKRLEPQIELERLDHHPKGSFLREHDLRIYGALDAAVVLGRDSEGNSSTASSDQPKQPRAAIGELLPSVLGFRGVVPLDGGWYAGTTVEHGYRLRDGGAVDAGSPFFDRALIVAIGHQSYGRIELGRREQPAWRVISMADPFQGSSIAAPGEALHYLPPQVSGATYGVRSDDTVTYVLPDNPQWQGEVQVGVDSEAPVVRGMALRHRLGAWQLGMGWQRWNARTHAVPVAAVVQIGHWRGSVGATWGRADGRGYHSVQLGLSIMGRSGAHPGELRLALNLNERDDKTHWKLGLGYVHPLSRRTRLQWELGTTREQGAASRARLGLGIRHSFER